MNRLEKHPQQDRLANIDARIRVAEEEIRRLRALLESARKRNDEPYAQRFAGALASTQQTLNLLIAER